MEYRSRIVLCLFALAVVAGCASTKVTEQHPVDVGKIPDPITFSSTTSSLLPLTSRRTPMSSWRASRRRRSRSRPGVS